MKFLKSAVVMLISFNIAIFILQFIFGNAFTNQGVLLSSDVWIRPWTLITSMFLHSSIFHLVFNMYVLLIFGSLLESKIGTKRFLLIYFVSGILAGIVSTFFYPAVLGASGAIMGVMGVIIIIMPDLKVLFFFAIPMPLWVASLVIVLIDVVGIFVPSGIANIAHLAGLAVGLLYGLTLRKEKKIYHKKFSSKRHLQDEDIDEYFKSGRI
ncbi:rhomboid family intramembrane serine protease [Candidatus Woesearchaeota archaeon]|nr:MAG: rhomboid family intramembrane serine protease [Candidatus Woesearchaeota archaeon]